LDGSIAVVGREVMGNKLRISGLLANPDGADDGAEMVEVQNISGEDLNLSKYVASSGLIKDGSEFPDFVLVSGGSVRVVLDKSASSLLNDGGVVNLYDAARKKIVEVGYGKTVSGKWIFVSEYNQVNDFNEVVTSPGGVVKSVPVQKPETVKVTTAKTSKPKSVSKSVKKDEEVLNLQDEVKKYNQEKGSSKTLGAVSGIWKNLGIWFLVLLVVGFGVRAVQFFKEKFA
jgi:hypothetical protein